MGGADARVITTGPLTFDFCCSALLTKARYMSLRYFSSCLTREFVAMGRWTRSDAGADGEGFLDTVTGRLSTRGFSWAIRSTNL